MEILNVDNNKSLINLYFNKDIIISYYITNDDILFYQYLLNIILSNGINEFYGHQIYMGDELFLKCKKENHIICLSYQRLISKKSKGEFCYECSSITKRNRNIIDYNIRANEKKCKFIGNIKDNLIIYGKIPISAIDHTGYYQCLLCGLFFVSNFSNLKGCASCNIQRKKVENSNFRKAKLLDDYLLITKLMERNGKYIGTMNENGDLIPNNIPRTVNDSTAFWKCFICDHIWNTSYDRIQSGTWCPKCKHRIRKTIDDYINLPKLKYKNGKYLGVTDENGTLNLNIIPKTVSDNSALWECFICNYRWNATYNDINNGVWCLKCSGRLNKTINDYINLPRLCGKNGSYIGILEETGFYNSNKIPENIHTSTSYWICYFCNHKWCARYNDIQQGS